VVQAGRAGGLPQRGWVCMGLRRRWAGRQPGRRSMHEKKQGTERAQRGVGLLARRRWGVEKGAGRGALVSGMKGGGIRGQGVGRRAGRAGKH
jgi:hypothetical protein